MEKTMYYDFLGVHNNAQPQEVEIRAGPRELHHFFPWQLTKTLTENDVKADYGYLEISATEASDCMLKYWNDTLASRAKNNVCFVVHDLDTDTEHTLSMTKNCRGRCEIYSMHSGWIDGFVTRRRLEAGMKIGMYWDVGYNSLNFSVLD